MPKITPKKNTSKVVLVTGSRDMMDGMVEFIDRLVKRAAEVGNTIVVGDAEGVDANVQQACVKHKVPFVIYGITRRPRNHPGNFEYGYINVSSQNHGIDPTDYLFRDRAMVAASDIVVAVWNGHSSGTKYTYDYAVKVHKVVSMKNFALPKPEEEPKSEKQVETEVVPVQPESGYSGTAAPSNTDQSAS